MPNSCSFEEVLIRFEHGTDRTIAAPECLARDMDKAERVELRLEERTGHPVGSSGFIERPQN